MGRVRTGNTIADALAKEGRGYAEEEDRDIFIENVRERVITATVKLFDALDKRIEKVTSHSPSTQVDDLSVLTYANREPRNGTSVT